MVSKGLNIRYFCLRSSIPQTKKLRGGCGRKKEKKRNEKEKATSDSKWSTLFSNDHVVLVPSYLSMDH